MISKPDNFSKPCARNAHPAHERRWQELAATTGDGLRKLLASGEDLQEATWHCANSLLSRRRRTADELLATGRRLLAFAIDPLEKIGRDSK